MADAEGTTHQRVRLRRRTRIGLNLALAVTASAGVGGAQARETPPRATPPREQSFAGSVEPTSREAASWLAEQPQSVFYRLALARALVREGQARSSLPHFDAVLARDSAPAVLAEAASAYAAAGDHGRSIELYRRAVERAPGRALLQQSYARALADRARYYLELGDDAAAADDLEASVALRPTREGYMLLGDAYRSLGQFNRARAAYEQVIALHPADREASSRLALLASAERPEFRFAPLINEELGAVAGAEALTDNAGFRYVRLEGRAGFRVRSGTVVAIGLDRRVVNERSVTGVLTEDDIDAGPVTGVGATVGLAHALSAEELEAQIAARVGAARHSVGGSSPLFAATAVGRYRSAWSLWVEGAGGPAYAELLGLAMTTDTSLASEGVETLLSVQSLAVGVVIPLRIADLGARLERLWVSDGNARSAVEASARFPLGAGLSLLYAGGVMGFHERSALYWDPQRDVFHGLGFEFGARRDDGFAFTVRALPGFGRTAEGLTTSYPAGATGSERLVRQFAADADLSVERERWDAALGAAFTTGRAGGYRQLEAGLRVRYVP